MLHSSAFVAIEGRQDVQAPIRFDPFEVSPDSGELRRNGVRLKLSGQAIQVLLNLLERPGQVVGRDELQKQLWQGASFGDFEHGLNAAVNRLREVLGDSANEPKYIETVPRRGYRFIATLNVERLPSPPVLSEVAVVAETSSVVRSRVRTMIWLPAVLALLLTGVLLIGTNINGWRDRLLGQGPKPRIRALAVLPLANLSADPNQEYFADAVTDALITEMGTATGPRVISRQSVMQYKNSKKSLQSIAGELNVDAVLEGTVERSGERVRVTVHLDQTSPERQLWSKKYDRDVRDLLGVQDDIARSVNNELQLDVSPEQHARLSHARVVDREAQDAYLRGIFSLIHGPIDSQAAVDNFQHAIQIDPNYARAYSGLALAYLDLGAPGGGDRPPNETLPKAKEAARRAVELDPSLAEAHVALGDSFVSEWNWIEAETEYQRALHLNPSDANAHVDYAQFLSAVGRHAEALSESKYAVELDPYNPDRRRDLGWNALRARQYDFAVEQLAGVEDNGLGWAYLCKKMYPEAIAAMERHGRYGRTPFYVASLATFYGRAGRRREALLLIAELKRTARHRYVSPLLFMNAYSGLDKNQTLTWLERGYEEHDEWMVWTKVWPLNDELRSDPRFQALIRRMNYPQ